LPVDRWIYSRLNGAAKAMEEAFLSYRFNDAAQTAYEYFWNDFCDWYVEATKLSIRTGEDSARNAAEKDRATTVLLDVLAESLRLLHPLLPFVTEEIHGKLPNRGPGDGNAGRLLIVSPYPRFDGSRDDPEEERRFAFLQEFVRMIRTLRSECTITPDKKLRILARLGDEHEGLLRRNEGLVKLLAGIGELGMEAVVGTRPEGAIGLAGSGFEIFVFIAEAVDTAALKRKFAKELERDRAFVSGLQTKLANEQFLKNAPPDLVAGEKTKLDDSLVRVGKLESYLCGL
ncbi:MAG: class I tRNA ligase family protein, partial [Treponema sp.]|nr:class I tRNA ligase family protein [Treponema sp.]